MPKSDAAESVQKHRIRQLLDRRARVIDALEATSLAHAEDDRDHSDSRLVFAAELRSLIIDLYPVLLANGFEDYVEGEEYGEFAVEPPEELPTDPMSADLPPGAEPATNQTFDVEGLQWFMETELPIAVTWSIGDANGGSMSATKRVVPPMDVCMDAFRDVIEAMNELNIDAQITKEEEFEGDYSDILEDDSNE